MKKRSKKSHARRIMFEGLPVVDAAEDIEISITPADIKNSKKKEPGNCAAAVAGKRELHKECKVFMSRIYVKDKKHWVRFVTPGNMSREIISFDRGSEFVPGEYAFKAPSEGQRLGHIRNVGKHTNPGKTKRKMHVTGNVRVSAKTSYHSTKE